MLVEQYHARFSMEVEPPPREASPSTCRSFQVNESGLITTLVSCKGKAVSGLLPCSHLHCESLDHSSISPTNEQNYRTARIINIGTAEAN